MVNNDQVGNTLAEFYLALRNCNDQGLVHNMHTLTQLYSEDNSNDPVAKELLNDCQKKCAQFIRSQYIDQINAIVSSAKKKLAAKFASNTGSQSNKHYGIVMELLGYFSNIIAELNMRHCDMSASLLLAVVLPFHERVISMVYESIAQFVDDKKLLKLQMKPLEELSGVILLDASISGLMMLITVLHQYSSFLARSLRREQVPSPLPWLQITLDSNSYVSVLTSDTHLSAEKHPSSTALDLKFMQFKEFDLLYTALECMYISKAMQEALWVETDGDVDGETEGAAVTDRSAGLDQPKPQKQLDQERFSRKLLLIQGRSLRPSGRGQSGRSAGATDGSDDCDEVYVLESVEDVFFVLNKSLERALISNSSHGILAVCNKIVEVLDAHQNSEVSNLLLTKNVFDGCVRRHKRSCEEMKQAEAEAAQATADAIAARAKAQNEAELAELAAARAELEAEMRVSEAAEAAARALSSSSPVDVAPASSPTNSCDVGAEKTGGDEAGCEDEQANFNQAGVDVAIMATTQLLATANTWWDTKAEANTTGSGVAATGAVAKEGDWLSSFASMGTDIVSNTVNTVVSNTVSTVNSAATSVSTVLPTTAEEGAESPIPVDWTLVPLPEDVFSVTVELPAAETDAPPPTELPAKPIWERRKDPGSSNMYYVNHISKASQWTHPSDPSGGTDIDTDWNSAPLPTDTIPPPVAAKPAPILKTVERPVWERRSDPKSGKCFYINHQTKETSWVHPADVAGQQALTLTGSRRLDKLMNLSIGALTPLLNTAAAAKPVEAESGVGIGVGVSESVQAGARSGSAMPVAAVSAARTTNVTPQPVPEEEVVEEEAVAESVVEVTKLTSLNDISVYLSTLGICHNAIKRFESLAFDHYVGCVCDQRLVGGRSGSDGEPSTQPSKEQTMIFEMILSELGRCKGYYQEMFYNEAYEYVRPYTERTLQPLLLSMMGQFNISGQEYDGRLLTESYPLLMQLRRALGVPATSQAAVAAGTSSVAADKIPEGYIVKELKPGLSSIAYKQTLFQIGNFIAEFILARIFSDKSVRFSEWGALLLQEEIFQVIHLLEDATIDVGDMNDADDAGAGAGPGGIKSYGACSSSKDNIALMFHRLVWCLKIMTLDQPGDAVRYNIPAAPDCDASAGAIIGSTINSSKEEGSVSAEGGTMGQMGGGRAAHPFEVIDDDDYYHSWHKHPVLSVSVTKGAKGQGNGVVLFSEKMVRCILSRRVEFSKEHISKLKLIKS